MPGLLVPILCPVYTTCMHITGFPPVIGANPHTLILGSMPGSRSIDAGEYYAHPRNAFWGIMEAMDIVRAGQAYVDRLRNLEVEGIALWDVLHSCDRAGSLDSSIRAASEAGNDICGLLDEHPSARRILLNGAKAEQAFERHIRPTLDPRHPERILVIRVPSTSPAHAIPFAEKLRAWQRAMAREPGSPSAGGE